MADLFISYSRKDIEFVRALHEALTAAGREAWVDWEDIPLTADWMQEIHAAIEAADTFLFVISPDSVVSDVCTLEIEHAARFNKRFVPVYHREVIVQLIHPALRAHNFIYFREMDDFASTFQTMLAALDTDLDYVKQSTRLLVRAIEWDSKGRDDSYVLRGRDLREAESWLSISAGKKPEPTALHLQYIVASRQAAIARQRLTVGALVAGLIIAVALAALAFYQSNVASTEASNRATAQAIAQAEAKAARAGAAQLALNDDNTELAIILALAATNIDDPPPPASAQRTLAEAAYRPGARRVILAHPQGVQSLAVSSDGRYWLTAGCAERDSEGRCSAGQVILWDAGSSERIREWDEFDDAVSAVAFSPDDQVIAAGYCTQSSAEAGCVAGEISLWDVETGAFVRRFQGHTDTVNEVVFSPDGMLLASAGDDALFVWDVATGEMRRRFVATLSARVKGAAFSPDGRFIVSGADIEAALYNLETGEVEETYSPAGIIESVAYSPDGKTLLFGGGEGIVSLVDVTTGDEIRRFIGHTDQVNTVAFSSDGRYAVSGAGFVLGADRSVIVWDVETGAPLQRFEGHGLFQDMGLNTVSSDFYGVTGVRFTPDGKSVVSSGGDGTLRLWDVQNGALVQQLEGHQATVIAVAYSPDGRFVASGSLVSDPMADFASVIQGEELDFTGEGEIILWDAATGAFVQRFLGHSSPVRSLAFSPDGQYLASGSETGEVIVWRIPTGDLLHRLEGHTSGTWSVAFSADGRRVVSGGLNGELFVWDREGGQLVRRLEGAGADALISDLVALGDRVYGRVLQDGTSLMAWNVESGEQISQLRLNQSGISAMTLSPDGRSLLTGDSDGRLQLWDAATGERIGEPMIGHEGGALNLVQAVAFSPDGQFALSGGSDTTVILWDMGTRQTIRRFRGHTGTVNSVAFSPDGHTAVSAGGDNQVLVWRIDTLPELITWTYANRYVREPNCNERIQYQLLPACDQDGLFVTHTPYPTLTPPPTFTPSPTVDLNRTTATPTPTITPTFTPTPTSTAPPSPTPTATPELLEIVPFDELESRAAELGLPFTPLLPREAPPGLNFFGAFSSQLEATELTPGGLNLVLVFSSENRFDRDDPKNFLMVGQQVSPYADLQEWAASQSMAPLMQFQDTAGIETATFALGRTDGLIFLVVNGLFMAVNVQGVDLDSARQIIQAMLPIVD